MNSVVTASFQSKPRSSWKWNEKSTLLHALLQRGYMMVEVIATAWIAGNFFDSKPSPRTLPWGIPPPALVQYCLCRSLSFLYAGPPLQNLGITQERMCCSIQSLHNIVNSCYTMVLGTWSQGSWSLVTGFLVLGPWSLVIGFFTLPPVLSCLQYLTWGEYGTPKTRGP